jgi:hypothetical protein
MQMQTLKPLNTKEAPIDRGLQRLAGAVLIQALQDASSGPKRSRDEAIDWIFGRTMGKLSFEFCCSLLGRDSNDVIRRLRRFSFMPRAQELHEARNGNNVNYLPD